MPMFVVKSIVIQINVLGYGSINTYLIHIGNTGQVLNIASVTLYGSEN